MKKAMVLFQRHGSGWDPSKPVREQAFWDEHARFVDALYAPDILVAAEVKEWTIFLDGRDRT